MAESILSFPHPVVGNGDDALGDSPKCALAWQVVDKNLVLIFSEFSTNNDVIEQLLNEGIASWVVRAHCRRTYYRREIFADRCGAEFKIPAVMLDGDVELETFVVALGNLTDYVPSSPHPDYSNTSFQIVSGGLLAIGPTFRVSLDIKFDPLKAPVSAFLKIKKGDFEEGPMRAIWESEDIVLELSSKDWTAYAMLKQDELADVLHAAIVLPVLVEAVNLHTDLSVQDMRWAQRLQGMVESRNLEPGKPLATAQQLLDFPISRALGAMIRSRVED